MPTGKPFDTVPANECFTTELTIPKKRLDRRIYKYTVPSEERLATARFCETWWSVSRSTNYGTVRKYIRTVLPIKRRYPVLELMLLFCYTPTGYNYDIYLNCRNY